MSKIEECWVIQRDDGKIFAGQNSKGIAIFCYDFEFNYSNYVYTKKECERIIKFYNLQNCRPVKVKIEIVGE